MIDHRARYATILSVVALLVMGCDEAAGPLRVVGQLESDRVEIVAEVNEPILERHVVEGQTVSRGDLLISQDISRISQRILESEAAVRQSGARLDELVRGPRREQIEAARADVAGAQQEFAFRQKEFERAQQVHAKQLASPELLDRATAARDSARARLDAGRAKLEELLSGTTSEELRQAEEALHQAESRLKTLQIDLARHSTTAPGAGVVDSLLFETGERPQPGQPIAILLSGAQVYARVYIPEAARMALSVGDSATIHVDGLDNSLDGKIRWISSEAAFTPYFALTERDRSRLTYLAKIDILDADRRLPDGVPVEVSFPDHSE